MSNDADLPEMVKADASATTMKSQQGRVDKIADSLEAIAQSVQNGIPRNRPLPKQTPDQALWVAIRNRGKAMEFQRYERFIQRVLCETDDLPCNHETCDNVWDEDPSIPVEAGVEKEGKYNECSSKSYKIEKRLRRKLEKLEPHYHGVDAYDLLKTATEAFLLIECGVFVEKVDPNTPGVESDNGNGDDDQKVAQLYNEDEEAGRLENRAAKDYSIHNIKVFLETYLGSNHRLGYIDKIINAITPNDLVESPFCTGIIAERINCPCMIELIWSYWQEEGMLVQVLNAVSLRFQNRRTAHMGNGLANLDIAPLHPLNNFLWGFIQNERDRTSLLRRTYEYDHHYGLKLIGKSVPRLNSADSRSRFIEGFHNLLHLAGVYYRDRSDLNVIPEGFPLLNALKELHLLLAQGAHNQYGDLPWTARAEMLIQQWLLARPEMDRFLGHRQMVPYREPWEGRLDTAKRLLGLNDVSSRHFNDLARFGENLLLSVRFGNWSGINNEMAARNWADYWREEIQGYIHAYRVATGVELNADKVDITMPSVLLQRRSTPPKGARS